MVLSASLRADCQTWRRTVSRASVASLTTWKGSKQIVATGARVRTDLAKAGPRSIDTASTVSVPFSPTSSKNVFNVSVSFPALSPHGLPGGVVRYQRQRQNIVMHLKSLHAIGFKRFTDLTIDGLSPAARLIVLAGPNGSGKSSFFDALKV
jgi:hypothetical protein